MGEAQNQPFQLSFNPRLRIGFQGSRVTSDGGLILVRELDERLGQQRLMKPGGRLVKHARYYWLLLAEGHLTRCLFGAILRRLEALSVPAG